MRHFNCTCHPFYVDQNQTLNEWLSRIYNLRIFCSKISIHGVFAQHELVKTRIFHPESFCPPKPATRNVFTISASVLPTPSLPLCLPLLLIASHVIVDLRKGSGIDSELPATRQPGPALLPHFRHFSSDHSATNLLIECFSDFFIYHCFSGVKSD